MIFNKSMKQNWSKNTSEVVKNAYARMTMLRKLNAFDVPIEDLLNIYVLYIGSRLEQSAVVWHSSITQGEEIELERDTLIKFLTSKDEAHDTVSTLCKNYEKLCKEKYPEAPLPLEILSN